MPFTDYPWQQAAENGGTLPPETVEFAHRMFDAARSGDTALLSQAIDAGLPANLTNEKGQKAGIGGLPCH